MTGHIDLGLTFQGDRTTGLRFEHLIDEDLILVAAPGVLSRAKDGNLEALRKKSFAELQRVRMILPAGLHSLRALIDSYVGASGVTLQVVAGVRMRSRNASNWRLRGWGCTILSHGAVRNELLNGLLSGARIGKPSISRPVYLGRAATRSLSAGAEAIHELVLQTVQRLVADGSWPARSV